VESTVWALLAWLFLIGRTLHSDRPFYLSWRAKEFDFRTRFIELAGEINNMPYHVLSSVSHALNRRKKSVNRAKVLILGVATRKTSTICANRQSSRSSNCRQTELRSATTILLPLHRKGPEIRPADEVLRTERPRSIRLRRHRDRPLRLRLPPHRSGIAAGSRHPQRHEGD